MREYPGKVWKGKKMAGRLGGGNSTVLNQKVVKIDADRSLLFVRGQVPGCIGGLLRIRDAAKKIDKQYLDLLYPTYIPKEGDPRVLVYEGEEKDPLERYTHENDVVAGDQGDK